MNHKRIMILLALFLITGVAVGFAAGYSKGMYDATKFLISVGREFVDIQFDDEKLISLIELYKLHCGDQGTATCIDDLKIERRLLNNGTNKQ